MAVSIRMGWPGCQPALVRMGLTRSPRGVAEEA